MTTEAERQAAYTAHDHNAAWAALWQRCEDAEAARDSATKIGFEVERELRTEIERLRLALINIASKRPSKTERGRIIVTTLLRSACDVADAALSHQQCPRTEK